MGRPILETPVNARAGEPSSFLENVPTDVAFTNKLPIRVRFRPWPGTKTPATLQVSAISYSRGASDDTMIVKWTPDADSIATEHFADMLELFSATRRLDAFVIRGRRDVHLLFAGQPQVNTIQWTDRSQGMTVTCLSDGQVQARYRREQQILGRIMSVDPSGEWIPESPAVREVTTLAPIFNCGGKPNRGIASLSVSAGGHLYPIHLFTEDNAPDARYWSYSDALRYVAFWYGLKTSITVNTTDFLADTLSFVEMAHQPAAKDPFIRDITRRCDDNVSIQSTNLDEAIAILTKRAGLDYQFGCLGGEVVYSPFRASYRLRVFGRLADPKNEIDTERQQLQPARRDLPRDTPLADYTGKSDAEKAESNACNACNVSVDQRVVTYPIFMAGHRLFEASWLLRPGWEPHDFLDLPALEEPESPEEKEARIQAAIRYWIGQFLPEYDSDDPNHRTPRSVFHAEHLNHVAHADVFRLWIWPDSAEIDATQLARTQGVWTEEKYNPRSDAGKSWLQDGLYGPGFSDDVAGHWVPRWRPFRDTIGRADSSTTARPPIVRIHFGGVGTDEDGNPTPPPPDDTGWRVYMTDAHVLEHRAAMRFTDADIFYGAPFLADPTNRGGIKAIEQFIRGDFWVSITACVRGDDRLKYAPPLQLPGPVGVQTIDLGFDRFQYNMQNLGNSHLKYQGEENQFYLNRDDTTPLKAYGDRMAVDMRTPSVGGFGSIFWLTRLYSPGDVITGMRGMSIDFERYPVIERVTWKNVDGDIQTELILTDLRSNPEVTA